MAHGISKEITEYSSVVKPYKNSKKVYDIGVVYFGPRLGKASG